MNKNKHWQILLSNQVHKKTFLDQLLSKNATGKLSFLNSLNGILFSDITIENFIEKEYQYDSVEASDKNRKLRTFSSGERKKEFLNYCIKQNPDFIIFDNPLDHLDQASRITFENSLEKLSKNIQIIQLVNRAIDFFHFIKNKAQIIDNSFTLSKIKPLEKIEIKSLSEIPKPEDIIIFEKNILVKLNNVSVSYDEKPILNKIFWTIKKGDFWQLIGPNGSGKSTILSLISGDNPKGYGQNLYLFGRKKGSGESVWDIKKNIGYFSTSMTDLFQKNHTLEQMILSGFFDSIGLYTEPTTHQKIIVSKWLEVLQMTRLKNKIFKQLSIGQQRVAMIVRAVLKHPPLVILDEPVEGLDDENVNLVTQLINKLVAETNMTIIYVSHRIEPTLNPKSIFELIPSENGSKGVLKLK